VNPTILGIRLDMLLFLYRRRVRAHPVAELLAGGGVAVGVALVFGVLLANASLTSSTQRMIHGLAGSARYELTARSPAGLSEAMARRVGNLPGVLVAAPVLRENVTLLGPRGEQPVQLIGLTPSLEALGGAASSELESGAPLLKGGLGLPSGVVARLGARRGVPVRIAAAGSVRTASVRMVLGNSYASVASSPVAVAVLGVAQRLAGRPGRVSEVLIRPVSGADRRVAGELARLAAVAHLDLRPATDELRLLEVATRPNRQSTSLFSAIAVMIGFLLALSAVLLTASERRRFVAELRLQGYDSAQIALLLVVQALALGLLASLAGIALGWLFSRLLFTQVPGFLTEAFPIGAEQAVRTGAVLLAVACGVLASLLASLLSVRLGPRERDGETPQRSAAGGGDALSERAIGALVVAGIVVLVAACALALLAPRLTVFAGVALALACVCLVPGALRLLARALPYAAERARSPALIVALTELRATTVRSSALAGIVALAVFGGIAIGGARRDLLDGIGRATDQYFATAPVWVTAGRDVFNTNAFPPGRAARAIASAPGVSSVRVYRGALLDVGDRRMWVRARPAADTTLLESSQLLHGDYATATRLIRAGGWAAVSSDFAEERGLRVGGAFALPTPSGAATVRVAAIATNSGWPAGTITLAAGYYERLFGAREAAALEVGLRPGVTAVGGRRAVVAALGAGSGLRASTADERSAQSAASARQGLRTLQEIAALLLLAAALAVAAGLSAAIWQRRARLASLKLQGYDAGQLWRGVLVESTVTIAAGALVGAIAGVLGHALAGRFLQLTTGFPAPFAPAGLQVLTTVCIFAAIAFSVIALPGMAAARVSPRAVLQE
jgi:putative ABC transport system permease protein